MKSDPHHIKFRLTFDIDPTKYPDQYPDISVASSDPMLNRRAGENFRVFLEHYCNQLDIGIVVKLK